MKVPTRVTPRTDLSKTPLAMLSVQGADANAFGAPIGQGLVNLGAGVNALTISQIEKDRKIEDFETARRFTEEQTAVSERITEAKRQAPPTGVGVRNTIEEIHKTAYDKFMATVPERSKGEYALRVEQVKQGTTLDAVNFENKAADAHFSQSIADEASKAKVAVDKNPGDLPQWNAHVIDLINKSGLTAIQKEQEARKHLGDLAVVKYKAMVRTGAYSASNLPVEGGVDVFVDRIFAAESGGKVNAQNKNSSASGLGQFLDRTWVEQLRLARPDLAAGQPDAFLLGLKLDPALQKQVTKQYATQNANILRNAGYAPTPGNIYLAHFLGPEGAKRVLAAPDGQVIQTVVGTEAFNANKEVFDKAGTVAALKEWAVQKVGGRAVPPTVQATKDANGYWNVPGVQYELEGKVRAIPPAKEYVERVVPTVQAIDPSLGVKFVSGGQDPFTGKTVGSHRHDINEKGEAHTTDFVLTKNGKPVTPKEAPELYEKAVEELAAQGFTGIGHYAWGLHVGGGSRAVWGPDKTSASADPKITKAVQRGWARAGDLGRDTLDTDPTYASIPYEDRLALRADGQREAKAQLIQDAQTRQTEQTLKQEQLYLSLFDGKAGQLDIDKARAAGLLTSFDEVAKAAKILAKRDEGATYAQAAQQKLSSGGLWDPQNAEDRKMLNEYIGDKGKEAIAQGDRGYFTSVVVPVVSQAKDIPTEVAGALQAMLRSNNPEQALFALDGLGQLQRAEPKAYAERINSDVQRDVDRYTLLRNVMPADELLRTIRGGSTQEERQATVMRRKDGEELLAKKDGKTPKIDAVIKEIVGDFDGWFSFAPKVGQTASAVKGVERFVETVWLEEYAKTGNADVSTELAKRAAQARFGVTELGNRGKHLMELPPEKAGYKPYGGDYTYIDKSIRRDLNLPEDQKYELVTDEQTRVEFKRMQTGGPAPSYNVILTDAKGIPRAAVFDERGQPRRLRFAPAPEDVQRDIDFAYEEEKLANNKLFFKDNEAAMMHAFKTGIPVPAELKEQYERLKAENKSIIDKRVMERVKRDPDKNKNTLDLRAIDRDLLMQQEDFK